MQAAAEEGSGTYASITDTGVQVKIGEVRSDPLPPQRRSLSYRNIKSSKAMPICANVCVSACMRVYVNTLNTSYVRMCEYIEGYASICQRMRLNVSVCAHIEGYSSICEYIEGHASIGAY
jgi:hypothetical protein